MRKTLIAFVVIFCGMCFGSLNVLASGCADISRTQVANTLGTPQFFGMLTIESATCDGLVLESDNVSFLLSQTALPIHGGIRSEVALDFPYIEGDTIRYSWDMRFPADFKGDIPANRWWLVAQWHDQPDRRVGEQWAGFPARSPPIALYLEMRDQEPGLGVISNGQKKLSWARLPLGEWIHATATIHWSSQDDGELLFEVDGHPEFTVRQVGGNMLNQYQHYLKLGQYRHPGIKVASKVSFRSLSVVKLPSNLRKKR